MSVQRTLAIVKPDAVAAGHIGNVIGTIEQNGFTIIAMKMLHLTTQQAEGFYGVHRGKPFFSNLVAFMTEGPVVVMLLERENAIEQWRTVMGATDPAKADEGTIRRRLGTGIERNVVHGSDAEDTACFETGYFFNAMEAVAYGSD